MKLKVLPELKVWLPKAPVLLVTVWGTESLFVQITVAPTGTLTVAGEKARPERLTFTVTGSGLGVVCAGGVVCDGGVWLAGGGVLTGAGVVGVGVAD